MLQSNNKILSFFNLFEKVYCINLDRDNVRWETLQQELAKVWLTGRVQRISAVDLPYPHVGCALSHRSLVDLAKKNKYKNILVFEDDISFELQNIHSLPDSLPPKWDIIYGSGLFCLQDFPYVLEYDQSWYSGRWISSGHCIAYNESFYDIFLSNIPFGQINMRNFLARYKAFDSFLSRHLQNHNNTYILRDFICTQRPWFSHNLSKEVDKSKKILKRFEFIKRLPLLYKYIVFILLPVIKIIWDIKARIRYLFYRSK